MAMSDKQFVAMVFDPKLKSGDTIPKIEGRPWDGDIGELRVYLARWYSEVTIEYLMEQIELSQKMISLQKDLLDQWSNSSPRPNREIVEVTYDALKKQLAQAREQVEAQAARITTLEAALQKIVDSAGCCEACECWRKLRNKASAALTGGKS